MNIAKIHKKLPFSFITYQWNMLFSRSVDSIGLFSLARDMLKYNNIV